MNGNSINNADSKDDNNQDNDVQNNNNASNSVKVMPSQMNNKVGVTSINDFNNSSNNMMDETLPKENDSDNGSDNNNNDFLHQFLMEAKEVYEHDLGEAVNEIKRFFKKADNDKNKASQLIKEIAEMEQKIAEMEQKIALQTPSLHQPVLH